MRRIIAIIDPDIQYSSKLAEYMNSHETGGLKAVAFSDVEAFRQYGGEYDAQILLMQEGELVRLQEKDIGSSAVMALSEDGLLAMKNVVAVFKYSRADRILREVLKAYSECASAEKLVRITHQKAKITGIYSPIGRCGKTSFALCLSCTLAARGRTLLISMDEYAGVFRFIAAEAVSDFSDVIYAYRQGSYSWSRLLQSVYRFGTVEYMPPVRYAEDIHAISVVEMSELLLKISSEGGYEYLILDIGSYGKNVCELLEICDSIYMPVTDSEPEMAKTEEFREMLEKSGFGELLGRTQQIRLPYDSRFEKLCIHPEDYLHGELYEFAGAL